MSVRDGLRLVFGGVRAGPAVVCLRSIPWDFSFFPVFSVNSADFT